MLSSEVYFRLGFRTLVSSGIHDKLLSDMPKLHYYLLTSSPKCPDKAKGNHWDIPVHLLREVLMIGLEPLCDLFLKIVSNLRRSIGPVSKILSTESYVAVWRFI